MSQAKNLNQEHSNLSIIVKQARFLETEKRYQEACEVWQLILTLHKKKPMPKFASQAYTSLGRIYLSNNRLIEAESIIKEGLVSWPNNKGFLILNAQLAQKKQQFSEAVDCWQRLREKYPEAKRGYFQAGNCLIALRKFEQAKTLFKEAAAKWPDVLEPLKGLANIAQKQQKWSEALDYWQLVHKRFPEFRPAYIQGGRALLEVGNFEEAEAIFKVSSEKWPKDRQPLEGLAQTSQHLGKWSEALKRWQRIIDKFPENIDSYIKKGNVFIQLGKFVEAEEMFSKAAHKFPNAPQPLEGFARIAQRQLRWSKALERWEKVSKPFPENIQAHIQKGNILIELGKFGEAESTFKEAAAKWPHRPAALEGIVRTLQSQSKLIQALSASEKLLEDFPNHLPAYMRQGNILIQLGENEKAKVVFMQAIKEWPNALAPHEGLIRLQFSTLNWLKALEMWENLTKRFSYCLKLNSWVKQGNTLIALNRFQEAENIFLEAAGRWPESPEPLIGLARIAQEANQLPQALLKWDKIIHRFPEHLKAYIQKGNTLIEMGRLDEAENLFIEIKDKWSESHLPLEGLARTMEQSQNWPKALQYWNDVLGKFSHKIFHFDLASKAEHKHKASIVTVKIPEIRTTVKVRLGTSDIFTLNQVFTFNEYELPVSLDIGPKLIIDAGANVGYTSVWFANAFPGAKIVAIEPEENNFDVLKDNTKAYSNIQLLYGGVWYAKKYLKVLTEDKNNKRLPYHSFRVSEVEQGKEAIKAYGVNDLLELSNQSQIDILKIDVEGAEKEIFAKNLSWLSKTNIIVVELHDRFKEGCSESVYEATKHLDFTPFQKGESTFFIKNKLLDR